VNKKPQKWVAKKNLFDGKLETDGINGGTGAKATDGNRFRTANYTKVKPNTAYIWSGITADGTYFFDANYTFISGVTGTNQFTTPSNAAYALARFLYSANPSGVSSANVQLEEGSTATPYEPFQLVLPKAKTGLAFNGVTDYLQLPSMTMDSIEIECLIDPVQVQYAMILDARTGLGGALNGSLNTDFKNAFRLWIDGVEQPTDPITIPRNKRIKIKVLSPNIFTDDVTIFTHYNRLSNFLKGTLYKVTCYLNGGIIAQYDFENPRNIVGNQVIPNAQNLIPSFEDSRWSIHPNAKVLGKDVLHLDATAVSQGSRIKVPVIPNTQYKFVINCPNGTRMRIGKDDGTTNGAWLNETNTINTFTAPSDCQQIIVTLENNVAASGSFDFIRPQLYQLTGQEGTINGSPVPQLRHAKRRLYSKR
jgi:hypothetical protein